MSGQEQGTYWIIVEIVVKEVKELKMKKFIAVLIMVFAVTSVAFADNIDVGYLLYGGFAADLTLYPDQKGDIAVILNHRVRNHTSKIDSKGDMTTIGDFEILEGKKHSGVLGAGYRFGSIVPWVAISTQETKITKYEIANENTKLTKKETKISQPEIGVAFGLNAEHWVGPLGVSGTVAKIPDGIILNGRVKYNIVDWMTAHVGYLYDSHLGHGVMAGLGVVY